MLSSLGQALLCLRNSTLIILAIVDDDMLPKFFSFLKGNLRKCLLFTSLFVLASIAFGSLDHVAPLVAIFYLLCYGGINIACFLLDWLGSPNWRPRWRYYHKATAFLGVVCCVASMIIISWWASLAAIIGAILIYAYFDKKSQAKNWGDGIEGIR